MKHSQAQLALGIIGTFGVDPEKVTPETFGADNWAKLANVPEDKRQLVIVAIMRRDPPRRKLKKSSS